METLRALARLAEPPAADGRRLAAALKLDGVPTEDAYQEIFGFQLPPYASIYLGAEGMLGGEARDRIAGTWRAVGLEPPREPDHLSILLAAYASLAEEPAADGPTVPAPAAPVAERRRHLARVFLWDHLLSWLPPYLRRVREVSSAYRDWAELLAACLAAEAARFPPPKEAPLALRSPPPLPDPRTAEGSSDGASGEDFIGSLLAPAVSGLILTRADLDRLGRDRRLGIRRGERAYLLRALLSQNAATTLDWLADEARRQAGAHRADLPVLGPVARTSMERAEAAARLLDELAHDAAEDSADDSAANERARVAEPVR